MTQKLLLPVPTNMDADRARALLEAIRRRVAERKVTSYADLLRETLAAVDTFFAKLSKPVTEAGTIDEDDDPRDPEKFNDFTEDVYNDLRAAYSSAKQFSQALASGFNFTSTLVSQLEAKVRKIASKSQDLQHVTEIHTEDIISVGDDFSDASKIDKSFELEGDQTDVLGGSGAMLHRVEALSVTDEADITVEANAPIYEGKLYALEGEAEPEGGRFHFKLDKESAIDPAGSKDHEEPIERMLTRSASMAEIDGHASDEEKQAARRSILDGNPDSYWQAETVLSVEALRIMLKNKNFDYYDLVSALSGPGIDFLDLAVTMILKLKEPQTLNFLVLDPLNDGSGNWLEVTDVATSEDGDAWEQLEGFTDHNYENVLTDEANEELTEHEVGMTLAPTKYKYSGKGLWAFPARFARYLRVTIVQRVPVPAPYDVLKVELQKTVTETVTKEKNKSFMQGLF